MLIVIYLLEIIISCFNPICLILSYRCRRLGYFTVRWSDDGLLGILLSTGVVSGEGGVTIIVGISLSSVSLSSVLSSSVLLSSGELFIISVNLVDFLAISSSKKSDSYNCL